MAQAISLISGSPLIGCPIVYSVQPEAYGENRTFHRIIVRVYAKLETDEDYTIFDFSNPVETKPSGSSYVTVASTFDISSALVAVADKYEYEANPTFSKRYPYIKYRIVAWDEWMIDGVVSTDQGVVAWPSLPVTVGSTTYDFYGYAFMGAFNDMERMGASIDGSGVEYLNITYLSRKPNTSPEIVFKNSAFIYPAKFERSIVTDHMTDDVPPVFVSGAPTELGTAYRYDNVPGQSTTFAADGAIVLLLYSDIESDYALKICHVEPISIDPLTGRQIGGNLTWEYANANIGDAYYCQQYERVYVATLTGWVESSIGPKSESYTPSVPGAATIGDHSLYVINRPTNGYELRFVNGFGCLESVHVTSYVKKESNINTEKYTVARRETLKKFSRALTVKTEDYETWALTSGPLDEDWVSWYVHEFLMAQVMWIGVVRNSTTVWLPCHVIPEETTMLLDKEKASMMYVLFRVELDINGSIK